MKYLVLKFEGAGLFNNHKGTKDKVIIKRKNGIFDRTNSNFKEPITVYQISNVIHCLFGERPVPTMRTVFYKPIDYYFEKAKKSLINISTAKKHIDKTNTFEYQKENISVKKAVWNSFNPNVNVNWYTIKKYLSDDGNTILFDFFVDESNKLFNCNVRNMTVYDLKNLYLSIPLMNYSHIVDKLIKNKKTALSEFIMKKDLNGSDICKNYLNGTIRTINNGIDNIVKLNGYIYVPINDQDIERLRIVSTGTCTILDGGIVYIDSIKESYELSDHGLILVGDISLDRKDAIIKNKTKDVVETD